MSAASGWDKEVGKFADLPGLAETYGTSGNHLNPPMLF